MVLRRYFNKSMADAEACAAQVKAVRTTVSCFEAGHTKTMASGMSHTPIIAATMGRLQVPVMQSLDCYG